MAGVANDELRTRLESVPLFAACHSSDLAVVARRSEIREVPAGTALIRAGDVDDEFFVLLAGGADVLRNGERVATLEPGAHFGELALLDPAPRSADVVMTADGIVSVLSRENFALMLGAIPGIAPVLLAFLARRLRDAEAGELHEAL
jgi:CRP/FNR family transcriptional regulator, cyclic AMP receptor protein